MQHSTRMLLPALSAESALPDDMWVDLRPVMADVASAPEPEASLVPEGPPGDQTRLGETPSAAERGSVTHRMPPSPDAGRGAGRAAAGLRRDRSTLRTRLTDGAETYQIARDRTGRLASSPQPVRQEPKVGSGDSSRTRTPENGATTAAVAVLGTTGATGENPSPVAADEVKTAHPGIDPARGVGPLDTEQGEKRFDVNSPGPAREVAFTRAAS